MYPYTHTYIKVYGCIRTHICNQTHAVYASVWTCVMDSRMDMTHGLTHGHDSCMDTRQAHKSNVRVFERACKCVRACARAGISG